MQTKIRPTSIDPLRLLYSPQLKVSQNVRVLHCVRDSATSHSLLLFITLKSCHRWIFNIRMSMMSSPNFFVVVAVVFGFWLWNSSNLHINCLLICQGTDILPLFKNVLLLLCRFSSIHWWDELRTSWQREIGLDGLAGDGLSLFNSLTCWTDTGRLIFLIINAWK